MGGNNSHTTLVPHLLVPFVPPSVGAALYRHYIGTTARTEHHSRERERKEEDRGKGTRRRENAEKRTGEKGPRDVSLPVVTVRIELHRAACLSEYVLGSNRFRTCSGRSVDSDPLPRIDDAAFRSPCDIHRVFLPCI